VDFQLVPVVIAAGQIFQKLDPAGTSAKAVSGAEVVFTDASDAGIPGRIATTFTSTDPQGVFSIRLAPSTWNIVVRPTDLPPSLDAGQVSGTSPNLVQVFLPSTAELLDIDGGITSAGTPLADVSVLATTVDGVALSQPTVTEDGGGFALVLPPGTSPYYLTLESTSDTDLLPLFSPFLPPAPQFDIGALPDVTTLGGQVVDSMDAGLPSVHVRALRTNFTAPITWTLERESTTDSFGNFSMFVRNGDYVVEAVPAADPAQPAMSGEVPASVDGGTFMGTITCPPKAQGTGKVLRPDGTAAGSGFQISALRIPKPPLATERPRVTSVTDPSGTYKLIGDPGQYRVTVVPPPESGLPLTYAAVELHGTGSVEQLAPIQFSPSITVFGTVTGPAQTPLAGATVDFYAVNPTLDPSQQRAVLIGSTRTDANGAYSVVLADVPNPTGP
jgi:hypothetical protein